jgi:hypothetical protein
MARSGTLLEFSPLAADSIVKIDINMPAPAVAGHVAAPALRPSP